MCVAESHKRVESERRQVCVNMNERIIKKTQDSLGKIVKKAPLTQKLLGRPPFRFLHDIFTEVIRTTGFMKGLYGESELKSDNMQDKELKMAFLQKAIDVVMLVSGEPLAAKPAHIVAGNEPEKTNELLQAIAKCCLKKMSSDDAVKRVLAGEKVDTKAKGSTSRSKDKENREGREHHLDREENKKIGEHSGSRAHKTPEQSKEQESRRKHRAKEHHHDKDHRQEQDQHDHETNMRRDRDHAKDEKRDREHQAKDEKRVRDHHTNDKRQDRDHHAKDKRQEGDHHAKDEKQNRDLQGKEKNKDERRDRDHQVKDRDRAERRDRGRDRHKEEGRNKERDKKDRERDQEKDRKRDRERMRERDPDRDEEKRSDKNKEQEKLIDGQKEGDESSSGDNVNVKARVSPPQMPSPNETRKAAEALSASDGPAKIPRPSSAKGQRQRLNIGNKTESDSEGDGLQSDQQLASQENGDPAVNSVPSDMASRAMPRPSTARPAPRPVKRQESYTDLSERMSSVKPIAPVIMDGKRPSEDEDEQFVIEAVPPPSDAPVMQEHIINLDREDKHGGLVKKILETKKDFESSYKFTQNVVSEEAQKRERDIVKQELEKLCSSIQMVCSSTLPLGTCMNYVQEDMDAMQAELHTWREQNREYTQTLQQEQRETDITLDPLMAELAELELIIKKEQEKIFTTKANILKNQDRIQKMTGVSFSP